MYFGVDVSAVQQKIDFVWLKNNGYLFVICRNYVGNDGKDAMCEINLAGAKAAGLYTAIYNFAYIIPTDPTHPNRDPESQAILHFNNTPKDEIVCIDIEWPEPGEDWQKWGIDAAFVNDWVKRYCKKYFELSGKKVIIYTYPSFAWAAKFDQEVGQYALWYADYSNLPVPSPWTDWILMQTSGGNKLTLPNGIPVDVDVAKNLSLWNVAPENHPTPTLPPQIKIAVDPTPPAVVSPLVQQNSSAAQPTNNNSNNIKIVETILEALNPFSGLLLTILKKLFHIR